MTSTIDATDTNLYSLDSKSKRKSTLTLKALKYFIQTMETGRFLFQFEIIINILLTSCRFISILMLWVYNHYKCINSHSGGSTDEILMSKVDPCAVRIKIKTFLEEILMSKVDPCAVRIKIKNKNSNVKRFCAHTCAAGRQRVKSITSG